MEGSISQKTPLLEVKDFSLRFRIFQKGLRERELQVIHRLDLTIDPGEIVAVVGASGSGKSLLADAILGILPENAVTSGSLAYQGEALTTQALKKLRGKEIALIPQSVNALDPLMKTGKQVQATVVGGEKRKKQAALFKQVHLAEGTGKLYPFELSGGMSRRVLVSTAMASNAKLIIADEPTPGLDPEALEEMLKQMKALITPDKGMMFITHDVEAALFLADKIVVFKDGETVDIANVADFTGKGEKLTHPYTKSLWNALPQNEFITLPEPVIGEEGAEIKSEPLIVDCISYGYEANSLLFEKVNLTLQPGEVVGLYGKSGSGKSTMAQVMAGYRKPLTGEVRIGDRKVSESRIHPVQLVWQHPEKTINPRWRLQKIIAETGGLDADIMRAFGIKEAWFQRWPSELSGGELQRFSLARALSSKNIQYLIADEMTTMLDSVTQANIWQTVLNLTKARQIGVLVISHDPDLLKQLSDRIIDFTKLK